MSVRAFAPRCSSGSSSSILSRRSVPRLDAKTRWLSLLRHEQQHQHHHQQRRHRSVVATSDAKGQPTGPLRGVKILDLTRVLAGPFCTQILADYGADVIKVEHPVGGDDTRLWRAEGEDSMWKDGVTGFSAYFSAINRNKKSITLNLKSEEGKKILFRLARDADVVVDNFIPGKMDAMGIGFSQLRKDNPGLIHASVSGYGGGGPYARRAGYDAIAAAEGGLLYITGEHGGNPTKPGVGLVDMCTGLYTHGAILAALVNRAQTGLGQKIDASLFETQVSMLANVGMSWLNHGAEAQRWGTEHPSIVPYDAFKTRDSVLVLGATNNRQFGILCDRLGEPSLKDDERFKNNDGRVRNRVQLKEKLTELFGKKDTDEWLVAFEGSGMPYGPVNNMQQVFSHPQAIARNMIEELDHEATSSGKIRMMGIPVKFSETSPNVRTPPPKLGKDTDDVLGSIGLGAEEIAKLREEQVIV